MNDFNRYKHLNDEEDKPFTMEDIAKWVSNKNYGAHRFVCALVEEIESKHSDSELARELRKVADNYTI